jgi:hypothetical protein
MNGSAPDWDKVFTDMVTQAAAVASQNWGSAQQFATTEFKKLAATGEQIYSGLLDGSIPASQGQLLLDNQRAFSISIIASIHLMNLVQAQVIVNAAVAVLTGALNAAIGMIKFV